MRDLANLGLGHFAQRHEGALQLRLAQAKQKIRLVFAWIDTFAKHRIAVALGVDPSRFRRDLRVDMAAVIARGYNLPNNRVLSDGDRLFRERLRLTPEITKLDFLIAHHAWVWCPAGLIFAREIIDHESLELVGFINDVMRNTQRMRNAARIGHCLWSTTFVFRARDAILRPDLHGDADDVVALLAQQIARNAGIPPAAHPKPFPLLVRVHFEGGNFGRLSSPVNVAEAPISKLQYPKKPQTPKDKQQEAILVFGGWSFSGVWML